MRAASSPGRFRKGWSPRAIPAGFSGNYSFTTKYDAPLRRAASMPIGESSKISVSRGVQPSRRMASRKQSGAGLGCSTSAPERMPSRPPPGAQVGDHVVDIVPAAGGDDPTRGRRRRGTAGRIPTAARSDARSRKRGVEGDLAQPYPFAFGGVGNPQPGQELVAPHAEIVCGVLLFGERVTRFAQGRDIGQRIGPPVSASVPSKSKRIRRISEFPFFGLLFGRRRVSG